MRNFFSPASLFASSEDGAWYAPSVIGTLYQTTSLLLPPDVGGVVGLMLDRSQSGGATGPVFGAQKSDSGADATEWYPSRTSEVITQSGSRTRATAQSSAAFGPAIVITGLVVGDTYLAEAACFASKSFGVFAYRVSTSLDQNGSVVSTPAGPDNRLTFIALATTVYVGIIATSDASGDWVEIGEASVKRVLGNHARQTTAAARPTLTASPLHLLADGVDDALNWTAPADDYTIARVNSSGAVTIQTMQALSGSTNIFAAENDIAGYLAINRALTSAETSDLTAYLEGLGA
jgi:hypothetical protein